MTIDEYLNRPRKWKQKSERLYKKLVEAKARVISPRDPLNLGDGVPGRRSNENTQETKLLNYIDASRAYTDAMRYYIDSRDEITDAINNLLYWQGCLIYQVYIYNAAIEADDDLDGTDEIIKTKNRAEILAKLSETKAALADLLRAQGVEIEKG